MAGFSPGHRGDPRTEVASGCGSLKSGLSTANAFLDRAQGDPEGGEGAACPANRPGLLGAMGFQPTAKLIQLLHSITENVKYLKSINYLQL